MVKAQTLDPEKEWFVTDDFFNEKEVKKFRIHTLTIKKSTKKDNATIQEKPKVLNYIFDSEGFLFQASKIDVRYGKKSLIKKEFRYDDYLRLIHMSEDFGYFKFDYFYKYKAQYLTDIIKIDKSSRDTLFHKRFLNSASDTIMNTLTVNDIGKAYMQVTTVKKDDFKSRKTTYTKSPRFEELNFFYDKKKLISMHRKTRESNQMKEVSSDYIYQNDKLADILVFENGEKIKRYGMVYNNEGLLKNVVIRNFALKEVEIYSFDYTFYSSN